MKNRSSDREQLYGFTHRIHGEDPDNVVELVRAELERIEFELTNNLRWEDDGGQLIGWGNPGDLFNPDIVQDSETKQQSTTPIRR
jgi:hypothetical protein